MKEVIFRDLGQKDYQESWDYQEILFKESIDQKIANRKLAETEHVVPKNYMLFVEHPHVYTLGKSGSQTHLLINEEELKAKGAKFYKINRGGDITYHGPGQIVGYPILDLDQFFTDVHKYLRFLEEAIIQTLAKYGIDAGRIEGLTGVWLNDEEKGPRKIAALGVKCSRWVTMHGFAFNVNSDLNYFKNIVPCGIDDKAVTSMENELGEKQDIEKVKQELKVNLAKLFEFQYLDEQ